MQTDSIRYFYHCKYEIDANVKTEPASVNIEDFDGSQRVLLSGGLTNPTFLSQESCRHTFIHSPTSGCFISLFIFCEGGWGVVALICRLITQTPLRQPDRLSAAGVLGESHQQPAHARPDHQEFHRWETCSEFRKSPCIHLIVMDFSSLFLLAPWMKKLFHPNQWN